MNIETNVKTIAANIAKINTNREKLVTLVQATALAVTQHAHMHGDVTLLNKLCASVGNGMKGTALKLWLLDYAPVSKAEGDDAKIATFKYSRAKSLRDDADALAKNMTAAAAKPWYDYKTEKTLAEFYDVNKALMGILNKANKGNVRPEDQPTLDALRKLIADLPQAEPSF